MYCGVNLGILGLAMPDQECTPSCSDPPIVKLLKHAADGTDEGPQSVHSGVFALCLDGLNGQPSSWDVGHINPQFADKVEANYIPMVPSDGGYYAIAAPAALSVADVPLSITSTDFGEVILDSGTTRLLLKWAVFEKLSEYFDNCDSCQSLVATNGTCIDVPQTFEKEHLDHLPTIKFTMAGSGGPSQLVLQPQHYMNLVETGAQKKLVCFNIGWSDDRTILGDAFMQVSGNPHF